MSKTKLGLRAKNLLLHIVMAASALHSLNKLKIGGDPVEDCCVLALRGEIIDESKGMPDYLMQRKEGQLFREDGFFSSCDFQKISSADPAEVQKIFENMNVNIIVLGAETGRSVAGYSASDKEHEILFSPGSEFICLKSFKIQEKFYFIL